MAIGNQNGNSERLLSMEKDLFPERFELWKKLRSEAPGWSMMNFEEDEKNKSEKNEL